MMLRICLISLSFIFVFSFFGAELAAQESDVAEVDESTNSAEELSEDEARAKAIKELEEIKQREDEKKRRAEELAQQKKQEREQEQQNSKPKDPKKVFKPTEEISEDLPVPFPIDI